MGTHRHSERERERERERETVVYDVQQCHERVWVFDAMADVQAGAPLPVLAIYRRQVRKSVPAKKPFHQTTVR